MVPSGNGQYLEARADLLRCHWNAQGEAERTIRGEVVMRDSLNVSWQGRPLGLHVGTIAIRAGKPSAEDPEELLPTLGASLFVVGDEHSIAPSIELPVDIALEVFDGLWVSVEQRRTSVVVTGNLPEVSYSRAVELDDNFKMLKVSGARLAVATNAGESEWEERRRIAHIACFFSGSYLEPRSQVSRIVQELSRGLSKLPVEQRPRRIDSARELVDEMRSPFREPLQLTDKTYENVWQERPDVFVSKLKGLDDKKAAEIRSRFDLLWRHYSVVAAVQRGERVAGAIKDGFQPKVEELEELAARLLAMPELESRTLEWALLDALIYAECIAFAQTTLTGEKLFGIPLPGELKGTQTGSAFWSQVGASLATGALKALAEGIKLAATFAVASLLAPNNDGAVWTIAVGVTAARWIRGAVLPKAKSQRELVAELLTKMGAVHELLKTADFNPQALRHQLYEAASAGAVFSPWVFNILEKRIARETTG